MSGSLFSCSSGSPRFGVSTNLLHLLEPGDLPLLSQECGVTAVTSFLGMTSSLV